MAPNIYSSNYSSINPYSTINCNSSSNLFLRDRNGLNNKQPAPVWRINSILPTIINNNNYCYNGSVPRQSQQFSAQPASSQQPVKEMDKELAILRESPIETLISTSKYTLTIDMHIFKAEDIQVLMQKGQLTIQAEQEVKLNEKTSVVRRFVRRLTLPEDVNVEVFTTEMNSKGMLIITALKIRR